MASEISKIFGALGELVGVCPCCGELFYVSEARFYYDGQKPPSNLERLRAEERRLELAEEKLDEVESDLRETAPGPGCKQPNGCCGKLIRHSADPATTRRT